MRSWKRIVKYMTLASITILLATLLLHYSWWGSMHPPLYVEIVVIAFFSIALSGLTIAPFAMDEPKG